MPKTTESTTRNFIILGGYDDGGPRTDPINPPPEEIDYSVDAYYTFIDDFGSVVKEVRRIDIDYDIEPSISAYIFMSNSDGVDAIRHISDSFGSTFFLINRRRELGVVNGSDVHDIAGETVQQQIVVYGLAVKRDENKVETVKDEDSIRARGVQELDFTSPWIQREERAKDVAEFIVSRWSHPADILDLTITPNPALQTGDVVSVSYPTKGLHPNTHRYHIISLSTSFSSENGLSQDIKLRRFRG